MDRTLEDMARTLIESGGYRIIRRLGPQTEYHPRDDTPKLIGAVADVETTGTDMARDKIIELGIFENASMTVFMTKTWGFSDPCGPLQFSTEGWRTRARSYGQMLVTA